MAAYNSSQSTPQPLPDRDENQNPSHDHGQCLGYSFLASRFAQQMTVSQSHNQPAVNCGPVNLMSTKSAPAWSVYHQSCFQPHGQDVPRFDPQQSCFPLGGQRLAGCIPGVIAQGHLFSSQRLSASSSGHRKRHSQSNAYDMISQNTSSNPLPNVRNAPPSQGTQNPDCRQGQPHPRYPFVPCSFSVPSASFNHLSYSTDKDQSSTVSQPGCNISVNSQRLHTPCNQHNISSTLSFSGVKQSVQTASLPSSISSQPFEYSVLNSTSEHQSSSTSASKLTPVPNKHCTNQKVPSRSRKRFNEQMPVSFTSQNSPILYSSPRQSQHSLNLACSTVPTYRTNQMNASQPRVPNPQNWVQFSSSSSSAAAAVSSSQSNTSSTQSSSYQEGNLQAKKTKKVLARKQHRKNKIVTFWMDQVKEWYPDRHTNTYFLPPQHFNRIQHSIEHVADQSVLVPEMPSTSSGGEVGPLYPTQTSLAQSVSKVAGSVWTQPQGPSAPLPRYQETDVNDDIATEHVLHCIRVLSKRRQEIMMVISRLEFRKYLDKKADRIHAADFHLFPQPEEKLGKKCDGECDLIIIHRQCGIIVGEIKSVGAAKEQTKQLEQAIVKRVRKAVGQLDNAAAILGHLLSDVAPVPIIKAIFLPNITSAELMQALKQDPQLEQDFCQCLGTTDLSTAISRCLCADSMPSSQLLFSLHRPPPSPSPPSSPIDPFWRTDLRKTGESSSDDSDDEATGGSVGYNCYSDASDDDGGCGSDEDEMMCKLTTWWEGITNHRCNPDPCMTDDVYDQLLARFCGPASTVEIPTVTAPRKSIKGGKGFTPPTKVLRTAGQAVAETGLIMSTLTLYPHQVNILNNMSLHNLHLCGPPGTGKTLLLALKASQWLQQGHNVDIVPPTSNSRAVTMVIENQLKHILASGAGANTAQVRRHPLILKSLDVDIAQALAKVVSDLSALVDGDGRLFIIMDEVPGGMSPFLEQLKTQVPMLSVWCAGTSRLSMRPTWMREQRVTIPLRCPPVVQRQVHVSDAIEKYRQVLPYSANVTPDATDGPSVIRCQHSGLHEFAPSPEKCDQCGQVIAKQLNKLGVGVSGAEGLQYLDVLVVCFEPWDEVKNEQGEVTQPAIPIVRVLRQEGIPVIVLTSESDDDVFCDVALARVNAVAVSTVGCITGLERRIVVGMGSIAYSRIGAMSRCISQLIWIDKMNNN